jgi:outer membrane autotransporter protein
VIRDVSTSLAGVLAGRLNQIGGGGGGVTGGGGFNGGTAMTTHLTGPESGRSGAVTLKDTALWGNVGYTSLSNDNTLTSYDGQAITTMVGIDTRPWDPLTVGVAFGYERVELDTAFNQGTQNWNGYSATPYMVFRFLRDYSIDVAASYSRLNTDVTRLNGTAQGTFDSDRYLGLANLNGNWSVGNWRLGATVGYLYLHQIDDAYTETGSAAGGRVSGHATTIGQGRAGLRLGYNFGMVEPYVKGRVEHEFITPGTQVVDPAAGAIVASDNTGYVLGIGALFNFTDRLSGGLEATTTQGRENQDIWGVSGTIRFRF